MRGPNSGETIPLSGETNQGIAMKTIARCSSLLAVTTLSLVGIAGLSGCESEEVVDVTPRQRDDSQPKIDPDAMPGGGGMEAQGS